jgi:hypothetical protein
MAESVANQVLDGIVTQMSAIVGDSGTTYWYTPTRVAKVAFHLDDDLDQTVAASGQVIYLIRPGDEAHREGRKAEGRDDGSGEQEPAKLVLARGEDVGLDALCLLRRFLGDLKDLLTLEGLLGRVLLVLHPVGGLGGLSAQGEPTSLGAVVDRRLLAEASKAHPRLGVKPDADGVGVHHHHG